MRRCYWLCNPTSNACKDVELLNASDEIFSYVIENKGDLRIAESTQKLFIACAAFLRDWFPEEDFSICGMETLLSMALMQGKYDTNVNFQFRETPLDLLFKELETGKALRVVGRGDYKTEISTFCRNYDHVRPGDIGGMEPGTDIALSFYHRWLASAPPQQLEESVYECISAVAWFGIRDNR